VLRTSERLTPEDFRAAEAPPAPERPLPLYVPERPRAERVEIRTLSEAEARAGVGEVEVDAGRPDELETAPEGSIGAPPPSDAELRPDDLELVDALVGDINGRPLQARAWLEPMGARLLAESRGKSREQWRAFAYDAIGGELVAQLRNELLLAEARSALTPEEKAGLRVFLERFERDVVAANYGSPTLAEEQLLERHGTTLEQAKREREKALLIEEQLRTKVQSRVQVSQRDLQLEYERNQDLYNPPPRAVFLTISIRSDNAEAVAAITERLKSEPFAVVAEDERNLDRTPQVRDIPEGLENADLFGIPAQQEAASRLSPGEWAGPLELGTMTRWVYLDRIEDSSQSLYDVQLQLREQITQQRRSEEATRYLLKILNRAGIGDEELTALSLELLEVAERWYYRPAGT
jgi:DNA repair exonuclease SbcCD nuclease subunit